MTERGIRGGDNYWCTRLKLSAVSGAIFAI